MTRLRIIGNGIAVYSVGIAIVLVMAPVCVVVWVIDKIMPRRTS
jgi:hypothetical protein